MGQKVSQFTDATLPLDGEELHPVIQAGIQKKVKGKNLSGASIEIAPTYAAISPGGAKRHILVEVDETNFSNKSLYLYTGSTLLFLQTID